MRYDDPERRRAAHIAEILATPDWDEVMAQYPKLASPETLSEGQFATAKAHYSWVHNENGRHGLAPWCEGQFGWGQFARRCDTPGTVAYHAYRDEPEPVWSPRTDLTYEGSPIKLDRKAAYIAEYGQAAWDDLVERQAHARAERKRRG